MDGWDGMSYGDFYDTNEHENDASDHSMGSDNDNDEPNYDFDGSMSDDLLPSSCLPQANYTILSEKDIRLKQEEAVTTVTNFLLVSKTEAGILLRFFNWSVSKVNDEWFADEERVRQNVGLVLHPVAKDRSLLGVKELTCGICFGSHVLDRMNATPMCGHFFCDTCWTLYIRTAINDGFGCLTLHCADPSCGATIGEDMVLSLVSQDDGAKYTRYLLRSFVENNRNVKWCPAIDCEYAIEFVPGAGSYDVTCKCLHKFCWNCLEEAHQPLDCITVAKWIFKNSSESENINWILANSKLCPKCKRPIEKNHGCMHMTCKCQFQFCWLCLEAWSTHGGTLGAYYTCNRYEVAKQKDMYDEVERRIEMAKNSLTRYTHYYERWATHESSRAKALSNLQHMQAVQIEKLSDKQCQPLSQLKFLTEAWLQIVECRRVLKWTYIYGYYLPENEHAKRKLFEYVQGEAEAHLERLHQCVERDLQMFLQDIPQTNFNEFRNKLVGLTSVMQTYFENLVQEVESGHFLA